MVVHQYIVPTDCCWESVMLEVLLVDVLLLLLLPRLLQPMHLLEHPEHAMLVVDVGGSQVVRSEALMLEAGLAFLVAIPKKHESTVIGDVLGVLCFVHQIPARSKEILHWTQS